MLTTCHFLWNELEPHCKQRAAGSLELFPEILCYGLDSYMCTKAIEAWTKCPTFPRWYIYFQFISCQKDSVVWIKLPQVSIWHHWPVSVSSITERPMKAFSCNFQDNLSIVQGTIRNILGMFQHKEHVNRFPRSFRIGRAWGKEHSGIFTKYVSPRETVSHSSN